MFGPHGGPNPDFGFGPRKWSGPCRASSYMYAVYMFVHINLSPSYIVYFTTPCFDTYFGVSKRTGIKFVKLSQFNSTHFKS